MTAHTTAYTIKVRYPGMDDALALDVDGRALRFPHLRSARLAAQRMRDEALAAGGGLPVPLFSAIAMNRLSHFLRAAALR